MYWLKGKIKGAVRKETEYKVPVGPVQVTIPESAQLFAEALRQSAGIFKNRALIVLYTYEGGRKDTVFIPALQQILNSSPYKEALRNPIILLNASTILDKQDNFILDDHYNSKGHEKIAAELRRAIAQP